MCPHIIDSKKKQTYTDAPPLTHIKQLAKNVCEILHNAANRHTASAASTGCD